jgi:hypothetical protein
MKATVSGMRPWLARCIVAASLLLPLAPGTEAAATPVPENDLKAAFVYNFALFAEWPADTLFEGGVMHICIHPNSVMRAPILGLHDRIVRGKKIVVRQSATLDNLPSCHLLFVDSSDRERWVQIRKKLGNTPVLTVSDDEEIGHDGGMITLAMDGNRVVFDIDTRAARNAKITLSSKLLRLARSVQ